MLGYVLCYLDGGVFLVYKAFCIKAFFFFMFCTNEANGYFAKVCLITKYFSLLHKRARAGPATSWDAMQRSANESLCW